MSNCENCGKEVQKTEGKRPKKFCSDVCRATFHNKNKKKEPKYVLLSTHEAALKRIKLLEAQISTQTKPEIWKDEKRSDKPTLQQKQAPAVNVKDLNTTGKTNYTINTERPVKMEGESSIDYGFRVNEWKKLQK